MHGVSFFKSDRPTDNLDSNHDFIAVGVLEIPTLTTMDELKQRIMDATMFNIGQLASMMGFAWSGGCWAKYSGEDFRRKGDTWESH